MELQELEFVRVVNSRSEKHTFPQILPEWAGTRKELPKFHRRSDRRGKMPDSASPRWDTGKDGKQQSPNTCTCTHAHTPAHTCLILLTMSTPDCSRRVLVTKLLGTTILDELACISSVRRLVLFITWGHRDSAASTINSNKLWTDASNGWEKLTKWLRMKTSKINLKVRQFLYLSMFPLYLQLLVHDRCHLSSHRLQFLLNRPHWRAVQLLPGCWA